MSVSGIILHMDRLIFKELEKWKEDPKRKPLLLKGARQVGKTFALKEFGERYFKTAHYVNFEEDKKGALAFEGDLNPQTIIRNLSFHLNTPIDTKQDLLIFDEIQECPKALTSLKYFRENLSELALCAAGSHLGVETITSSFPVGNIDILYLFPMSFEEFLLGIEDSKGSDFLKNFNLDESTPDIVHEHLWEMLKIYFVTGGLPAVILDFKEHSDNLYIALDKTRKTQETLIETYMGDFAKHSGKTNALHIERIFRNIPEQLAKEIDDTAKRFRFKHIIPGKNRFSQLSGPIDWLVKAGFILKCYIANKASIPLKAYCKENIFKLYLFDIGLLGTLAGISPKSILSYNYGSYQGYFAENFVAEEFMASGLKELISWNENTSEIEFLRTVEDNIIPIEVKAGKVMYSKSLNVFANKYKPSWRVKVSGQKFHIDRSESFINYPLYMAYKFPNGI